MTHAERIVYNACQVYIGGVAMGIGIVLGLPGATFALSPTFQVLKQVPLTEDQWGIVFTVLGVACFISSYFSRIMTLRDGDADFGGRVVQAIYRLLRLTWFVSGPIWFFWAGCFLAVTPISIGTVFFLATGCLSLWVHTSVRKEARRNVG